MATETTRIRLATGLYALLEKKALHHISVRDIARESGLTRQVFYRYFHTRDDLVRWIYLQDFSAAFSDCDTTDWDDMVLRMMMALQKRRDFYRRLVRSAEDYTFYHIMRTYTDGLYRRILCCSTGQVPDPQTDFLLQLYSGGGIEMSIAWVREGMRIPPETLRAWLLAGMPARLRAGLTGFSFPTALISVGESENLL